MPHFIVDCSENVLTKISPEAILQAVYEAAEASGLFAEGDIKVRLRPFDHYKLGDNKKDFVHVFGNIMEGRSTEQKARLSRDVTGRLHTLLPNLSILSINIREFEKATYCNKHLLQAP